MRSLALLAEWEDDTKQAINQLQEALSLGEQIGLPGEAWPVLEKLGGLNQATRQETQAQQAFGKVTEIVQALAANIDDESLRTRFLASDAVQCVVGV